MLLIFQLLPVWDNLVRIFDLARFTPDAFPDATLPFLSMLGTSTESYLLKDLLSVRESNPGHCNDALSNESTGSYWTPRRHLINIIY